MTKNFWGKIAIIDLIDCKHNLMMDNDKLKKFIDGICKVINMKKFGPCYIERFGTGKKEGVSAFQFIETSSITIHLDEQKDQAFIDIFSCKNFDEQKASNYCKAFFGAKENNIIIHERGTI